MSLQKVMDLSIKLNTTNFLSTPKCAQYSKMSSVHQNVLIYLKIPIFVSLQKVMDVRLKLNKTNFLITPKCSLLLKNTYFREPSKGHGCEPENFRKREILHSYSDLYFYWS